jgi:hypothetical protein
MIESAFRTIAILLSFSVAIPPLAQQDKTADPLANVLKQASQRRREYIDLFKDLTAVETKTTELISKDGKVTRQREVISDFLVYASPKTNLVNEYRITREVDGKPVGKDGKQAVELFEKLAKAKTLEEEGKRLREENLKHTLYYYRWGATLSPIMQVEIPSFIFQTVGREAIQGREVIVLTYRRGFFSDKGYDGLLKTFKDPQWGNRGRIWLDAENFGLWRWVNENTVVDRDITKEVVFARDEVDYAPSTFGINLPKKIVTTFFDKDDKNKSTVRLAGRITYDYPSFKRFDVRTDYEIQTPRD